MHSETGLLFFLGWVGAVGGMVRLASKRVWVSRSFWYIPKHDLWLKFVFWVRLEGENYTTFLHYVNANLMGSSNIIFKCVCLHILFFILNTFLCMEWFNDVLVSIFSYMNLSSCSKFTDWMWNTQNIFI